MVIIKDAQALASRAESPMDQGRLSGDFPVYLADVPFDYRTVKPDFLHQGSVFYEPLKWKSVIQAHTDGVLLNTPFLRNCENACRILYDGTLSKSTRASQYSYGFVEDSSGKVLAPLGQPCIYLRFWSESGYWTQDFVRCHFVHAWREPQNGRVLALAIWVHWRYRARRFGSDLTWDNDGSQDYGCGIPSITSWIHELLDEPSWPPDISNFSRRLAQSLWERFGPQGTELDRAVAIIGGKSRFTSPCDLDRARRRYLYDDDIMSLCRHHQQLLLNKCRQDLYRIRPELDARALDKVQKFDGNLGLFASKILANPLGGATLASLKEFAQTSFGVKSTASLWLATRYGDRLAFSGFKDLVESLDRELGKAYYLRPQLPSCKARHFGKVPGFIGDVTYAVQAVVESEDANQFQKLIRLLMEWDAYPTLQNVWDAIPLSFVVDWFVNVGDIFQSIDRMVQSRYYRVPVTMESLKASLRDPVIPELTFVVYERTHGGPLRLGVSSVELGLPSTVNCISGVALLCG